MLPPRDPPLGFLLVVRMPFRIIDFTHACVVLVLLNTKLLLIYFVSSWTSFEPLQKKQFF
jgi:hypothetical protein